MREARVVRVIARLNVGGPALQAMDLTGGLTEGYPTMLVTGSVDEGEADLLELAHARGLRVVCIPELGRRLKPWNDVVAFVRLFRLLREVRPTVVHTHTAKAGTLGRAAAVLAGVPVRVHTFHGHVFRGYFGTWATRAFVLIERALARVTTRVVTVSESQARELVEEFRICGWDRMRVIPLGFDLTRFSPERSSTLGAEFRRELGVGTSEPVITIVGRLAPIKNHRLFLQMARQMLDLGQPARFVIVGGGTEEAALRAQTEELGIGPQVTFLGWRSDLERIYAGSDVVVLTSKNEGTPVCLIEALAAGRAVVAVDVGGVRDVLDDGRLGVLVAPGDARALAHAVRDLIRHPQRREELGRLGTGYALSRFGVSRLLHDVRSLYDELSSGGERSVQEHNVLPLS